MFRKTKKKYFIVWNLEFFMSLSYPAITCVMFVQYRKIYNKILYIQLKLVLISTNFIVKAFLIIIAITTICLFGNAKLITPRNISIHEEVQHLQNKNHI